MKKRTFREKLILSIGFLGLVLYGLYTFYFTPTLERYRAIQTEQQQIQGMLKDTIPLQETFDQLRQKVVEQEQAVDVFRQKKTSFSLTDYNLFEHIGTAAEKNDVKMTLFRELERIQKPTYEEVPFHFVMQGDYPSLLQVMNVLERLDFTYSIRKFSVKVINVDPHTLRPLAQVSEEQSFKWTVGQKTYVTGDFPLFKAEEVKEEGEITDIPLVEPIKKVQMDFIITFIDFGNFSTSLSLPSVVEPTEKELPTNPFSTTDEPTDVSVDLGEDMHSLSDEKRLLFTNDMRALDRELYQVQIVIYNREQQSLDTTKQKQYLKELLALQDERKEVSSEPSNDSSTDVPLLDDSIR